jgi:hypothetical protein
MERAVALIRAQGNRRILTILLPLLLPIEAQAGRWTTLDRLLSEAEALFWETGVVSPDDVLAARIAAQQARQAGEDRRRRALLTLALRLARAVSSREAEDIERELQAD